MSARERCVECDAFTGRAGRGEDSLYFPDDLGPLCRDCWRDLVCVTCDGDGQVQIMRNARGEVDYITGAPSGEYADCEHCNGTGHRSHDNPA